MAAHSPACLVLKVPKYQDPATTEGSEPVTMLLTSDVKLESRSQTTFQNKLPGKNWQILSIQNDVSNIEHRSPIRILLLVED